MAEVDIPDSLVDLLRTTAKSRNLPPPDFTTPYLDHLVSLPLRSLLREPGLISAEASTVESELTNLCFREYGTFISVHNCSAAVRSAFDEFEDSLERLIASVPVLEDECRTFTRNTSAIQAVRRRAGLVQEHQDKLLDLLELPQLMETCVRNGYYQEAMELGQHARELKSKYGMPLVQDLAKEVEGVYQLMLSQLLALLREPVKLPALVKAVSYLRRLEAIDEEQLGLVFLSSRLHNFRVQLVQIERDRTEPVRYLRRYIDLFREHVYDIISQYTSIFNLPSHIISFATQCVGDLVHLVARYVPRVTDSAALSSILVQLGYCALSFSRVGLDFSALVAEPFTSTCSAAFAQSVASASTALSTSLKAAAKSAASPSESLAAPDHLPAVLAGVHNTDISVAAHFPPLAIFVNAHVTTLNSLRLLAPVQILPKLQRVQSSSLIASTTAITQHLIQAIQMVEQHDRDRPKHARTPSSPRAHLLRRNTETQFSPEIRAARRKEAQAVCVAFADAWIVVVRFLTEALATGIFDIHYDDSELATKLDELSDWTRQYQPAINNGAPNGSPAIDEEPETTAHHSPSTPPETPSTQSADPVTPTRPAQRIASPKSVNIAINGRASPENAVTGFTPSTVLEVQAAASADDMEPPLAPPGNLPTIPAVDMSPRPPVEPSQDLFGVQEMEQRMEEPDESAAVQSSHDNDAAIAPGAPPFGDAPAVTLAEGMDSMFAPPANIATAAVIETPAPPPVELDQTMNGDEEMQQQMEAIDAGIVPEQAIIQPALERVSADEKVSAGTTVISDAGVGGAAKGVQEGETNGEVGSTFVDMAVPPEAIGEGGSIADAAESNMDRSEKASRATLTMDDSGGLPASVETQVASDAARAADTAAPAVAGGISPTSDDAEAAAIAEVPIGSTSSSKAVNAPDGKELAAGLVTVQESLSGSGMRTAQEPEAAEDTVDETGENGVLESSEPPSRAPSPTGKAKKKKKKKGKR